MSDFQFEPIDLRDASDEALHELYALGEAMRIERLPDDPPFTFATVAGRYRNAPPHARLSAVFARVPGHQGLVGAARLSLNTSGENAHLAQLEVDVLPAFRRCGLGRRLVALAAEEARRHERRLLMCFTNSRVPAGEAFARAAGARPGLEERHSQLVLAEVDRELLRAWQERAAERAAGFELLFWDHVYPEEHIEAFAKLCNAMNTAPRDSLEVEDQHITPAKARQWLKMMGASGLRVWTLLARDCATGTLAGVTELFINPDRPTIVNQGATVVEPAYRERGLGRWLKAALLERLIAARPEARFVRTDNAESNAPMLAINVALGFRPFMSVTVWQVATAQALAWATGAAS